MYKMFDLTNATIIGEGKRKTCFDFGDPDFVIVRTHVSEEVCNLWYEYLINESYLLGEIYYDDDYIYYLVEKLTPVDYNYRWGRERLRRWPMDFGKCLELTPQPWQDIIKEFVAQLPKDVGCVFDQISGDYDINVATNSQGDIIPFDLMHTFNGSVQGENNGKP
jgi:hypothetical protein